ncbi:MAG: RluA family pseudouridine synthase [Patescibacteria group bacterium]|nr:RluA family pseudouridine synthase [Patescibacteria group bacterium]
MWKKNNEISNGVNKFKIKTEEAGQRLDKFLASRLPDFSRSQIQKLIKQGGVKANGKIVSSHFSLRKGDEIKVAPVGSTKIESDFLEEKKTNFSFPEIIAETDEYLVINKPAGLIMHGNDAKKEKSLAEMLVKKYPGIKKIGEDPERPGIVHRLDKEASGLVVIAKTQDSFDNLKKQFQKRTMEKKYTALVYGQISKDEEEILFPLKRSPDGKMAALPIAYRDKKNADQPGVRRAITEFKVIKKFINYTLLKVKIKTGRTHQIRVHMLSYGHPLVGDDLYSTKKTREQNKKLNLGRIFLVADKLSFTDLAGDRQTFTIELPGELKEVLKKVK